MPFVWAGVLLLALRVFGVEPVTEWSWGWILAPFACAFVWFEIVEPLFGLDRGSDPGEELAEVRRKRIEAMFPHFRVRRRVAARASAQDDSAG
jgi:small Trp-rich protein